MKLRSRGIGMEREKVGVTATRSLRLPCALSLPGKRSRIARPSRTWARYSLPSVVSEKSARPNSLVPMICSSWRTRWLTALGVTHSSSAASVTERSRANASKVRRHWMGGMRAVMGSTEDHRLVPVQQHAVLAVPLHGAGQHLALGVAADGGEILHRVRMVHPRHVLLDDRTLVQVGGHVVRRGADQLHAAVVRLVVRFGALEA